MAGRPITKLLLLSSVRSVQFRVVSFLITKNVVFCNVCCYFVVCAKVTWSKEFLLEFIEEFCGYLEGQKQRVPRP
jgi:hypothetical protein